MFPRYVHYIHTEYCSFQNMSVYDARVCPAYCQSRHTVTWHPGKRNIHVDDQLLAARFIDDNRWCQIHPPIIHKFYKGKREDDAE